MYLLKKEEDIEITEKSLFKTKGFALLFPNHVQLVKSKRKGHTCISTPKIGQKTSSLPATRSCLVVIFFSFDFCARDFSKNGATDLY